MKFPVFLLAIFILASCKSNSKQESFRKDGISTDMVNNPRTADSRPVDLANMPTLDFQDTLHYFGKIKEGEKVSHEFQFTNNGKTPLLIGSATASCGCTVPEYPKDPVAPGGSGKMKVIFNSTNKSGHVEKLVTVSDNTAKGIHILIIQADIESKKQ